MYTVAWNNRGNISPLLSGWLSCFYAWEWNSPIPEPTSLLLIFYVNASISSSSSILCHHCTGVVIINVPSIPVPMDFSGLSKDLTGDCYQYFWYGDETDDMDAGMITWLLFIMMYNIDQSLPPHTNYFWIPWTQYFVSIRVNASLVLILVSETVNT